MMSSAKIISWPINTVPEELLAKLLDFYLRNNSSDPYYGGYDYKSNPPSFTDIPELFHFIEELGYHIDYTFPVRGNYLETNHHYPIHCDTGKEDTYNTKYTVFLIPLRLPPDCHSYLFLLNQQWYGEASTFSVQPWKVGWNHMIKDYSNIPIHNTEFNSWDKNLNNLNVKLTEETLQGMSLDTIYKWKIGSMISFPCTQLHFSTIGSEEYKIGLSLRLKLLK
jgi:hypothetical protein